MNYLSDDENDETQQIEEFEELQDEELDEETRNMIFNKVRDYDDDDDFLSGSSKKKEEPKKQKNTQSQPKKKSMSLEELIAAQKESEPKKWESSRAESKKKKINIVKEVKRSFNPRLPPYKTMMKDKVKNETKKFENNEENFPSLGGISSKPVVESNLTDESVTKPVVKKLNFKNLIKKE